ncbi:MAG: PilZ domain-containing protein [Candidatus Omnitrophica bacterium]|jgi:hypothetical protein|nr:PilZ domain-containing protein [Candidatus Omnitrophota bacterium]
MLEKYLNPSNKRCLNRIKAHQAVRYQIRGNQSFDSAVTDDLSCAGLSFTNDKFISLDTLLMFQINVLSRMISPIGRVCWVNNVPFSDRFRYGVQFVEVDPSQKRYLSDYVDMQGGKF